MKHISILVLEPEPNIISIVACYRAFIRVNQCLADTGKKPLFNIQLVSISRCIEMDNGLISLRPHADLHQVKKTSIILIPDLTWNFSAALTANAEVIPWIVRQYKQGAEVASMCTGGFLLASTGLLDGRSCSTHWMVTNLFRKMFPEVRTVIEKIITDEHGLYTFGGAFSFLQLILYLIEKYCGRETALYCASIWTVDIDDNHQSPFTMFAALKDHQDEEIKQVQLYIERNVGEKISIGELATKFAISRRNFDRRFVKATFNTPVEYVQCVKVEAAKKALETSRKTVSEVMYGVGYTDMKAFREIFKKITGFSPLEYRNKYNKEAFNAGKE
jgi:transcriptional regulator GlxA family with amidase domain